MQLFGGLLEKMADNAPPDAQQVGLWRAEEEELDDAADAAAGLLDRHGLAAIFSEDVEDLVVLGLAAGSWALRQARTLWALRRLRRDGHVEHFPDPAAPAEAPTVP